MVLRGTAFDAYTHLAVFYDSDAGRMRLSAPFLEDGLRAGQPCFLVAAGEVLDGYLDRLAAAPGLDLGRAIESGLLTIVNSPGTTVDEALQFWEQALWTSLDTRPPVIRVVGEMIVEREMFVSEAEMLAYEAAFNQMSKRFPCFVLCQYDVRAFTGPALLAALRAHPDLMALPLRNLIS